jgi:hypothetical protein
MVDELPRPEMSLEQRHTALLLQRLLGKRTSDRYVDLCRLAAGTLPLRVSVPLAGHAMREIDALLRQLLAPPAETQRRMSLPHRTPYRSTRGVPRHRPGRCGEWGGHVAHRPQDHGRDRLPQGMFAGSVA